MGAWKVRLMNDELRSSIELLLYKSAMQQELITITEAGNIK